MPYSEAPLAVLERAGMLLEGHFSIGEAHTSSVIVRDRLFADPMAASSLCIDIAQAYKDEPVDVVAGPAPRATNLIQFTAKALYICQDQKRQVRAAYGLKTKREPTEYRFSETMQSLLGKKRVLVVVDFMKSGDTARAFIKSVRNAGGTVVGVACICQRKALRAEDLGVPRYLALVHKEDETWPAKRCRLCRARKNRIPLQPSPTE